MFCFIFLVSISDAVGKKFKSERRLSKGLPLTLPNLLIVSKLLVFHAYVIHYFYNSKNKGEQQKL